MRVGDLVQVDTPGQRPHGKLGIVVGKHTRPASLWEQDRLTFSYEVLVDGGVWRLGYNELLEEEDWHDETG